MTKETYCCDCDFSQMNGNPVRPKRICAKFSEKPACVNARQEFRNIGGSRVLRDCGPVAKLYEKKREYRNQPST